jgi:hypothetical protein
VLVVQTGEPLATATHQLAVEDTHGLVHADGMVRSGSAAKGCHLDPQKAFLWKSEQPP